MHLLILLNIISDNRKYDNEAQKQRKKTSEGGLLKGKDLHYLCILFSGISFEVVFHWLLFSRPHTLLPVNNP